MNPVQSSLRVGYVLRSYPRLSQTFVVNEIRALEQLGVDVHIFAVTHPHEPLVQPQVAEVAAPVDYLESALARRWWIVLWEHLLLALLAPHRYGRTLYYVARHREFDEGYTASSRYACFAQAVLLAHLLRRERRQGRGIDHLHAHFAHDPALIAQLAHLLTGISYTFTAHARDIYQIPRQALAERIKRAGAVITCCAHQCRLSQDRHSHRAACEAARDPQRHQPERVSPCAGRERCGGAPDPFGEPAGGKEGIP